MLYPSNYTAHHIKLPIKPLTFEVLVFSLHLAAISLVSVTIYCPGNRAPCNDFFLELTSLFKITTIYSSSLLMSGDFNVHIDDINDNNSKHFAANLDSFYLNQHVCQPAHSCGHTLNLAISRSDLLSSGVNIDCQFTLTMVSFAAACLLMLPLTIVATSIVLNLLVTGTSSILPHFLVPYADLRYAIIHFTSLCLLLSYSAHTNTRSLKF